MIYTVVACVHDNHDNCCFVLNAKSGKWMLTRPVATVGFVSRRRGAGGGGVTGAGYRLLEYSNNSVPSAVGDKTSFKPFLFFVF